MQLSIITTIISATSIIIGSLVGAFCSYLINKKMHKTAIMDEEMIMEKNRKYEEKYKVKVVCDNANIIRLDIATAIFQSIRILKNKSDTYKYLYIFPVNKNYSCAVASLSHKYTLKELNYLYRLYGVIEKVNRDIYEWDIYDEEGYKKVEFGLKAILHVIYQDNLNKILAVNIDTITYTELYNNELIKKEYKELLSKLDKLCLLDNLLVTEENNQ